MTQETEEAPLELALVSCQTCDTAFIGSERRTTCPACGGEAAGPYFQWTLEADGLRLKNGAAPETREETPPLERTDPRAEPVTAAEMAEGPEPPMFAEPPTFPVLGIYMAEYLSGADVSEEDLRGRLVEAGAEPEVATIAVGRLVAVRELIRELAAAGVEAEVEVETEAGPTGEGPPEDAPVSQAEVEPEPAPAEAPEEPSEPESAPEPA